MIRLLSKDLDAAASKATDLTNAGHYSKAWAAWGKIRDQSDSYEAAYVLGGYVGLKLSKIADAELLLGEAVERFSDNPYSHLFYADCARAVENMPLAVERLVRAAGGNHQDNFLDAALGYILDLQDRELAPRLMKIFILQQFSSNHVPYIAAKLNTLRETNPPAANRIVAAFTAFAQTASVAEGEVEIFLIMQILCEKSISAERMEYIVNRLYFESKLDYIYEVFNWGTYEAGQVLAKIIHSELKSSGVGGKTDAQVKTIYAVLASFLPAAIGDVFKAVSRAMNSLEVASVNSCVSAGAAASNAVAPALTGYRSRLRIAICVSGQLRGYENARRTWMRLGLDNHDCNYFVHTWRNIGRKFPIPQHAQRVLSGKFLDEYRDAFMHLGEGEMRALYPSLFSLFSDSSNVSFRDVRNVYTTDCVVIEDDDEGIFKTFNNFEKMYYKIKMCHSLALMSGREYDLFIRIRPDLAIGGAMRSLNSLFEETKRQRSIFIDTGPYIHPKVGYVVGDQFAVADRRGMDAYAATYDNTRYASPNFLSDFTKDYRPHVNLAESLIVSGMMPSSQHGIVFDGWHEPDRITERELYAALSKDSGVRSSNHWDARLLAACMT
jgi:hypothetical protein